MPPGYYRKLDHTSFVMGSVALGTAHFYFMEVNYFKGASNSQVTSYQVASYKADWCVARPLKLVTSFKLQVTHIHAHFVVKLHFSIDRLQVTPIRTPIRSSC